MAEGKDIRHRLQQALAGEPVEQPVYAAYDWFVRNRPADWPALFERGLGQINHATLLEYHYPNAEIVEKQSRQNCCLRRDIRWITDRGELHEWYLDRSWRTPSPTRPSRPRTRPSTHRRKSWEAAE
jgi:hypothetical protein